MQACFNLLFTQIKVMYTDRELMSSMMIKFILVTNNSINRLKI